jgi:hypothetical protein
MATSSVTSVDERKFLLSLLVDLTSDLNYKRCFKAAHRDLHQFFWLLKKDAELKNFVQNLLFDINGNYPHSDQIDELLQEFQLSGVLSRPNPTYRYNDITINDPAIGAEFKEGLSSDQRNNYQKILELFKRDLGVFSTK